MQTKLTQIFNDKMSFVLRPEYHVIDFDGKVVLAVYIPECPKDYMPCYFRPVGLPNGAYIREGNTSRKITDNEFRTYVATSREFQFDRSEARGTKRVERYEYPEEAIRELIANAVIHRDYNIIETYNQIRIFQDRIEIVNPGSLPPGVTVDNIKDAQFSRNYMIAARLKDLKYLEEYGRGIDIVITKMQEWNLPLPLFRNSVNSFEVMLLGDKYRGLNSRQLALIDVLLLKNRLTVQDCQKILKRTPRATINSDLKKLKDLGILVVNGASKSTFYTLAF